MKESEERSSNIDEQKARIRQRYKGIDPEELEVIPALRFNIEMHSKK